MEQLQTDNSQSPFSLAVQENVAIVTINTSDSHFNLLHEDFIGHLRAVLGAVIYQKLQGLIFISAKQNNFIRGFNLAELEGKSPEQLEKFAEEAQLVMREIEQLKVPTVAAIHGDCYGVGLELALACRIRITTDDSHTLFAMPQVRSG